MRAESSGPVRVNTQILHTSHAPKTQTKSERVSRVMPSPPSVDLKKKLKYTRSCMDTAANLTPADPPSQNQSASVCESCFLVYAELASLAFRATGRQALTDHTMSTQFSAKYRSHTLSRLKLSEDSWQPLLKKKTSTARGRSIAPCNVPQQASPELPEPIRR